MHNRIRVLAALTAALTVVGLMAPSAASALPDPAPEQVTAVASLTKTASVTTVARGETFTYTLTLGCSSITDAGCRDAVVSDTVPAPFVLVDAVVGAGANTAAEPVITGNSVSVTWTTPLGDGTVGLLDATTAVVEITAVLPADTSYDVSGTPVVNSALLEAVNVVDVSAQVPVTPQIPLELGTTATKSFAPAESLATPGAPVAATLTGSNDSNATAESIVLQDPVDPSAFPNPFESLGFVGFGAVTAPAGATSTSYEVFSENAWTPTNPDGSLPPGISANDVRGTRVIFAGAIPAGASGSAVLNLAVTNTAALAPDGTIVSNTVQSEITRDLTTATDVAGADFTLRQNAVTVSAGKSFAPDLVVAGDSSVATLEAGNTSIIPIETLEIVEPADGVFPATYSFGGILDPIAYPAGATAGQVTYVLAGGGTQVEPFANGTVPVPPGDPAGVVSFSVRFSGAIQPGATTAVSFQVDTDPDLDPGALPVFQQNTVGVIGTNVGVTGEASASDVLYVYGEVLETYIGKTLRPSEILAVPGEVVTVSLTGGLTERPNPPEATSGTTGYADQVVLQDPIGAPPQPDGTWWNAFDLNAIAQTPVPGDSLLTIQYFDTTDQTWKTLTGPITGPTIYSGAVPDAVQTVAGGIRFVYDYTGDGDGFAPGTDFAPNFTSSLRPEGRYVPGPPFLPANSVLVQNCAESGATSAVPGVDPARTIQPDEDCPQIELFPPDPGNENLIDKAFGTSSSGGVKSVIARSGDTIPSTLSWSTGGYSGLASMRISDTAEPSGTPLASSIYNAFDLTRVQPITTATDPLIAFDQITAVQVFNGTGWVSAANNPCPAGCVGQFPGMNLTTAEQASTTGVRLVFAESPSRAAASVGNLDAPPVGSGVARSFANDRDITLVWRVRDVRRSDGTAVLGDEVYNLGSAGVVRNTVRAEGFPAAGGDPIAEDDVDDVTILDVPLTTVTNKSWAGGPLAVPPSADIPLGQFPLSRVTVTTRNTTPARVDEMRIEDPAPGTVTDRQQDPFQAFRFNTFPSITVPAGATSTTVTLFCPDGSSTDYTRTAALALTAATAPCDVSGVRVSFEGRIAANATGSVVIDLRLRGYWREQPTERVTIADSPVSNTAEGAVGDVDPIGTCPPPAGVRFACDQGSASIVLAEASLGIVAQKSITPAEQKEDDFSPVTVRLSAQPTGSARTRTATLEDDDPTFWNAFEFAGMDPSWAFVTPIGRVQVCYLAAGTFTPTTVAADTVGGAWTCSPSFTTIADARSYLTAVTADIHGLRVVYQQANQLGWSNPQNPVVTVPFRVVKRDALRSGGALPTTRTDQVPAPGETEAGVFTDTFDVRSVSSEISPGVTLEAEGSASDDYRNLHLEAAISVTKSPNGNVRPGVAIPFTLSFTNTGEQPLLDPVFTDRLPVDGQGAQLILDPDRDPSVPPWSFALSGAAPNPPSGLPLPTNPAQVEVAEDDDVYYFRMPAGTVFEPGQTYTITLRLVLRPGLTPADQVRNVAAIAVDVPFDACVPARDPVTGECIDDAVVSPLSVPALSTVKSVKADVLHGQSGIPEVFSTAGGYSCDGTADPDGFYRAPCVPVTLPGGTETWRFTVTNAGTLPMDRIVSIDNLPTPGDRGLIVVLPRQSEWEPTLISGAVLAGAPPGATLTLFGSSSSVPCIADLNPLGAQCAPGAWFPITGATDPATVRSVKFVVTFPTGDLFLPGESFRISFQTETTPNAQETSAYPTAWNTVSTGGSAVSGASRVTVPGTEGRRVGVAYPTGAVLMQKTVTGPAFDRAPAAFPVQLECSVDGVAVEGLPEITLIQGAAAIGVPGLPWGAICTASEGLFGQTSTDITSVVVGGPADPVGIISVTNTYDVADLTIRKAVVAQSVDQRGRPTDYGPFPFAVTCTFLGTEVWASGYGPTEPMEAVITPEETWALAGLPVGSDCTVTETDDLGSIDTSMTVTTGVVTDGPVDGTSVDVTIVQDAAVDVLATNTFGEGTLAIQKVLDGPGATAYGAGPFTFSVECTLDTGDGPVSVRSLRVSLGGEIGLFAAIDAIAAGAECVVEETNTGGATSTTIDTGSVVIPNDDVVTVTATNTFEVASLTVDKVVTGPGAELWGAGPFEVTLECLTTLDQPIAVAGGATRSLTSENGYTVSYDVLPVGALCAIAETDDGGATATTIVDAEGEAVDGPFRVGADDLSVTVTNTFEVGSIEVAKTVSGAAAAGRETDEFTVSLACEWNGSGIAVPGGAERTISSGESVVFDDLPDGADCVVREPDSGGASAVTFTPADPADATQARVTVDPDAAASVVVDNLFDAELGSGGAALPGTGGDATRIGGFALAALLLMGLGAVLVTTRRRRPVA